MDTLTDVLLYGPPIAGMFYAGAQARFVLKTELKEPDNNREDEELKMFTTGNSGRIRGEFKL